MDCLKKEPHSTALLRMTLRYPLTEDEFKAIADQVLSKPTG